MAEPVVTEAPTPTTLTATPTPEPAAVVEPKAPEAPKRAEGESAQALYPKASEEPAEGEDPTPEPDKPEGEAVEGEEKPAGEAEYVPVDPAQLKFPEGIEADTELLGEFATLATEQKLSPDVAQKYVDLGVKQLQKYATAFAEAQAKVFADTTAAWKAELAKDPQFTGERLVANQRVIGKVIDEFSGSPAEAAKVREAFALTGAGDHPALVRLFTSMSKALSEGGMSARPGGPPTRKASGAGALYPPAATQ